MKQLFMWICASMAALLLTACGGGDEDSSSQPESGSGATAIVSLQVTPPQGRIPVALELQYVAQALMSDGKVQDVTALGDLQWRSSDSAIATITSTGLATGVAPGKVTITASGVGANGTPVEARAQLEVSNAQAIGLQVAPPATLVASGLSKRFTATLQLSDGTTLDVTPEVSWASDDAGTATVAQGLATGIGSGVASLSASGLFQGKSVSSAAQLTVSDATVTALQVTPAASTTAIGLAQPLIATAVLSDGTSQVVTDIVSWSSGDSATATVSNEQDLWGLAKGVSAGTTTITAVGTFNGQPIAGSAQLKVSDATVTALQLTPPSLRAPIGLPQQYSATAMLSDGSSQPVLDASWSSSDPGMATISAAGLATGARAGSATLSASTRVNGQLLSGHAQLTVTDAIVTALQVTPARGSVAVGTTQRYEATALMSDGTSLPMSSSASWVSDPLVAILNGSTATGTGAGTTDISATAVVNGVTVSNSASLTVSGADVTSLEVRPGIEAVPMGLSKPFTVRAWLSDGSSQEMTGNGNISWSSSDSGVATVDGTSGLATGVALGSAYISAAGSVNGRFLSDSASLAVGDATVMGVEVTPDPATVPAGLSMQLTATAQMSDNSTQDITSSASWGSDAAGVATVIGGLTTGVSVGEAIITATDMVSGQSGSAALTVTSAVMTALAVTPKTATVSVGQDQQFDATATLSDGSTQEMTTSVSWSSGDLAIATIGSNSGLATGVAVGSSTITAMTQDGSSLSDTAELTVTGAGCATDTLVDGAGKTWTCPLTQSKADAEGIAYGMTYSENGIIYALLNWPQADAYCTGLGDGYYLPSQNELQGLYDEFGSLENHAGWPGERAYWSSTMGTNAGSHYRFYLGNGTSGGTAHDANNYDNVTCAKLPPTTVSLVVTPADSSFLIGETKQFTAMATLSDGSVVDASASVAWSSGNTAIATINGGGLATGVAGGATTIAATMQDSSGVSATTQLTVYYPLPAYGTGCVIGILVDSFGAEWTCPPLQSEVDAAGIPYDGTIKHNGKTYVTMTWPNGNNYCTYLGQGFRLPTLAEYQGLFAEFGNLSIAAGWPTSSVHWTGDYSSGSNHYVFNTLYGNHSSVPDAYPHFVSCRRAAE
ncbi:MULTISPECIES: Ig-like domain-containing protein [Aeromonas]|uniref:Ig-like domain-containing protein n=1 Tax=Aeromonas TaxID=642 RepID=UPI000DD00D41|nr:MULTISPECIES: Ig-like domain-containing protein [Aeromonas]MDM5123424.1 Ig-like domain-containing protein [Aeromonas rivipollensis]